MSPIPSGSEHTADTTMYETVQLEALAEDLQKQLHSAHLIKDRLYKTRNIPKSFLGSDLITVLVGILKEEQLHDPTDETPITRERALKVGRAMATEFGFFVHADTNSKASKKDKALEGIELQDSAAEVYRFENNLPIQVHKTKKQYPSMWDRVRLLEQNVKLDTHRGLVKTFTDCFRGTDAVDALVSLKLVRSRKEAVHVIRKMNDKVMCCHAVTSKSSVPASDFTDSEALYKFVPEEDRIPKDMGSTASPPLSRSNSRSNSPSTSPLRAARKKIGGSLSPKRIRRKQSMDHVTKSCTSAAGPNSLLDSNFDLMDASSIQSAPLRRTRSNQSGSSSRSNSPKKDKAYFEKQALDLRSRLDVYRDARKEANEAQANNTTVMAA